MKKFVSLVCLSLALACGGASDGDVRSGAGGLNGTGGNTGTGGTGGEFVTPDNIDQLCRDFCANADEGEDCGVSNCGRFINNCGTSDIQSCYESCLDDYQLHVQGYDSCLPGYLCFDYPERCPDQWLARLRCVVEDFECNDLFGDCDSLTDTLNECYQVADMELRDLQLQWCEESCPGATPEQCQQTPDQCWPEPPQGCSAFNLPPETCGQECRTDYDCVLGEYNAYCFNGLCGAQCSPFEADPFGEPWCDAGEYCDRGGRCIPEGG